MSFDSLFAVLITFAMCVVVVGVTNSIPVRKVDITVHQINGLSTPNSFVVASQDGTMISLPNFGTCSLIIDSESCDVVATRNIYGIDTVKDIVEYRDYEQVLQK